MSSTFNQRLQEQSSRAKLLATRPGFKEQKELKEQKANPNKQFESPAESEPESEQSKSEDDEITLNYIIEERPKTEIVREFFKENLTDCRSDILDLFDDF